MFTGMRTTRNIKPVINTTGKCENPACPEKDAPLRQEAEPDLQSTDWETEQPPYYHRDIF